MQGRVDYQLIVRANVIFRKKIKLCWPTINCGHKDKSLPKLLIVRISHHFTGSQGSNFKAVPYKLVKWSKTSSEVCSLGPWYTGNRWKWTDKRVLSPSGTWRINTRGLCLKGEIFGWKTMLMWEVKCAEDDRKHLTSEPTIGRPSRSTKIHYSLAETLLSVKSSALWDWAD